MSDWPLIAAPAVTAHPALQQLARELQARFRDGVAAIIVYGSCLRAADPTDGLVDLYLLCDNYSAALGRGPAALGNRLLPPNVYHAQSGEGPRRVRAKVALLSLADFRRGCSRHWFHSYLWGRFAQPVALLSVRDAHTRQRIRGALLEAQFTLLQRTLPLLPRAGSTAQLWERALSLSYGTELRTERSGRAGELVAWQPAFYHRALRGAIERGLPASLDAAGHYRHRAGGARRTRLAWHLRALQGKLLSLLRLLKAFFTFDGGIDYLVWKLERHSGERITVPARVQRWPLLFAWGFFWRLYRRGIFR